MPTARSVDPFSAVPRDVAFDVSPEYRTESIKADHEAQLRHAALLAVAYRSGRAWGARPLSTLGIRSEFERLTHALAFFQSAGKDSSSEKRFHPSFYSSHPQAVFAEGALEGAALSWSRETRRRIGTLEASLRRAMLDTTCGGPSLSDLLRWIGGVSADLESLVGSPWVLEWYWSAVEERSANAPEWGDLRSRMLALSPDEANGVPLEVMRLGETLSLRAVVRDAWDAWLHEALSLETSQMMQESGLGFPWANYLARERLFVREDGVFPSRLRTQVPFLVADLERRVFLHPLRG